MGTGFSEMGRSEIDRNSFAWEGESGVFNGRSDSFPTFLNGGVAKAYNRKMGNTVLGINFHMNRNSVYSMEHKRGENLHGAE
jgi:hypothetical protein